MCNAYSVITPDQVSSNIQPNKNFSIEGTCDGGMKG